MKSGKNSKTHSISERGLGALALLLLFVALIVTACSDEQEGAREEKPGKDAGKDWTNPDSDRINKFRDCLLSPEELARSPEFGGIVTLPASKDPTTLNNVTRTCQDGSRICSFLFPMLITIHPETNEVVPLIADGFPDRSADGLVYTWRLRPGIKWHDFEESKAFVTAYDVEFAFDLICNEKVDAARARSRLPGVESVKAVDDLTFRVHYSERHFSAMYTFGREMRIMPSHLLGTVPADKINAHPLGRKPVGYGPFRFHHWKTGDEVLLTRCDLNRDVFPELLRPWLDGIRWKIVPSPDLVFRLFERGDIDICIISPDDWIFKTESEEFLKIATPHFYSISYFTYLAWNNRTIFFDDNRVRRAMTHLTRRQAIVDSHLHGMAEVLSGPFYRFSADYDDSIEPLPFDPEKAKELLAEAGWKDRDKNGILEKMVNNEEKEFRFELLQKSNSPSHVRALTKTLTEELKSAGVIMETREIKWNAMIQQVKDHRFDAFTMAAVPDPLYQDHFGMWHSSQTKPRSDNRTGFSSDRVDEILETVRVEFDGAKRTDLVSELHRILHEEQPVTPLFTRFNTVGINRRWRNVRIYDKRGIHFTEWWLPRENRRPSDTIPPLEDE